MKANPTAGIILMLGAAALIVLGLTTKGKQILDILKSKTSTSTGLDDLPDSIREDSGGVGNEIKNGGSLTASLPGTHAGEVPASNILGKVVIS